MLEVFLASSARKILRRRQKTCLGTLEEKISFTWSTVTVVTHYVGRTHELVTIDYSKRRPRVSATLRLPQLHVMAAFSLATLVLPLPVFARHPY